MTIFDPSQIPDLKEPAEVKIVQRDNWQEFVIRNTVVAYLEKRAAYCDRGHWWVKCFLPGIDVQDGFPRYYMNESIAKLETIAWLNWRLWKIRAG
jgi:hypothetical protein